MYSLQHIFFRVCDVINPLLGLLMLIIAILVQSQFRDDPHNQGASNLLLIGAGMNFLLDIIQTVWMVFNLSLSEIFYQVSGVLGLLGFILIGVAIASFEVPGKQEKGERL